MLSETGDHILQPLKLGLPFGWVHWPGLWAGNPRLPRNNCENARNSRLYKGGNGIGKSGNRDYQFLHTGSGMTKFRLWAVTVSPASPLPSMCIFVSVSYSYLARLSEPVSRTSYFRNGIQGMGSGDSSLWQRMKRLDGWGKALVSICLGLSI